MRKREILDGFSADWGRKLEGCRVRETRRDISGGMEDNMWEAGLIYLKFSR